MEKDRFLIDERYHHSESYEDLQTKIVEVEIPVYSRLTGVLPMFDAEYVIHFKVNSSQEAHISANKSGLVSLARLFLTLAQEEAPVGVHVHLNGKYILEPDSDELTIGKNVH